ILRIERGLVRVADAQGAPPSLPFWVAEAPSRTRELSELVGLVREQGDADWLVRECGVSPEVAREIALYLAEGRRALGTVPTQARLVLERFFDESGGAQLVLHSLYGGRINRALGLALRKRFCRRFGFELQAAANEDAIVLSLTPEHSFPLEEVFDYLRAESVEDLLVQAVLVTPTFAARWRWNAGRSLLLERFRDGRPVAPQIQRMRADDLLAACFPAAAACGETLPPGDLEISDHPMVRQTIEDCLHEAMDVDGLVEVLRGLRDGSDFDYEMQMAGMNATMAPEVQTLFLPASPQVRPITATLVRQIAAMGGDVSQFVPVAVNARLKARFAAPAR
ncbi:MAG: ATP-dependent DNA helicase, partial [Proteobacteria bacterium]|nr:ATP-dependent DNA helicase [Pseudomonadota bacterium]